MYKNVEFLFSKLKQAPIGHHSWALSNTIPQAIEVGLNEIGPYLDARYIQTESLKKLNRGQLNTIKDSDYARATGYLWDDNAALHS